MTRFLPLLLVCACAGSLADHSGNGGGPCPDGQLKCVGGRCDATATKMFCWGRDDCGQVGNGGTLGEQPLEPTEVIGVSAPLAIAAGDAHTCAATSSQVLCWGQNAAGQLGTGAEGPASSTPGPA